MCNLKGGNILKFLILSFFTIILNANIPGKARKCSIVVLNQNYSKSEGLVSKYIFYSLQWLPFKRSKERTMPS